MTRRTPAAVLAIATVLASAGCAPMVPTATSASTEPPSPSPAPATAAPIVSPSGSSTSSAAVVVDASLLALLPVDIGGQALRPDDATAAEIAATGDLARDIEAIAVGLYIQPGSSNADDLAIVSVVRLRPGVFGDDWFRSWRSTYDDGACQVAGGVAPGGAETRIGDHATHIGTCVGGVHTYHVYLTDPDRVVSITAAGEGRYGERVVAGLTE